MFILIFFFFSSRRRHTRLVSDWSSDVCSSDLVKAHVDAIASKYIRPDEGTYDFAFMYLPSEAIYYELTCGKTGALLEYAHGKRVVPVSPTTLTAYLQEIGRASGRERGYDPVDA